MCVVEGCAHLGMRVEAELAVRMPSLFSHLLKNVILFMINVLVCTCVCI